MWIAGVKVVGFRRYRGFMLDTGRNFYPKEDLMKLLDSMAYNKMNYFHWHINDAASFPMYSNRVPKMTYYGAYDARKVYYPEDIREIVEYANVRFMGILFSHIELIYDYTMRDA